VLNSIPSPAGLVLRTLADLPSRPHRRDVTNWLVTDQLPRRNASLFLDALGVEYEAGLRAHITRIRGLFPALPLLVMHTSLPFSCSRHVKVPL